MKTKKQAFLNAIKELSETYNCESKYNGVIDYFYKFIPDSKTTIILNKKAYVIIGRLSSLSSLKPKEYNSSSEYFEIFKNSIRSVVITLYPVDFWEEPIKLVNEEILQIMKE